jgi:hypothetical protein
MIHTPSNLDRFDNTDPRVLTVLVIGTEANVRTYMHDQHRLGVVEMGTWSKLLPVPNCPDKVMTLVNRMIV